MQRAWIGGFAAAVLLGAATLGGGCGGSGNISFNSGGAGTTGGGATTGSQTGPGTGTTGTSGMGGMTATGTTSGTTGTSTDATTGTSTNATTGTSTNATTGTSMGPSTTSSTTSGMPGCAPDPNDDACVKCAKSTCCDAFTACESDNNCVCWTGCYTAHPGNFILCFQMCGNPSNATNTFGTCTTNGGPCANACGQGSGSAATTTSSTSSGGGACAPEGGDTQCTACSKMKCCNQVTACVGDQNCQCWGACLQNGGSFGQCAQPTACGQPDQATNNLIQCSLGQCASQCG